MYVYRDSPLMDTVAAAAAAAVFDTSNTTSAAPRTTAFPTRAPRVTSTTFPAWAIFSVVIGAVAVLITCLSYHFNLCCFARLRRRRMRHRQHSSEMEPAFFSGGRTEPLPGGAAVPHPNPFADPSVDIIVYARAPATVPGGHHWVPSFSRMYNRSDPAESRGAYVTPCSARAAVAVTSVFSENVATLRDDDDGDDDGGRHTSDAHVARTTDAEDDTAVEVVAAAVPMHDSPQSAVSAPHPRPAPRDHGEAVWMTAGTPLRFFSTALLLHTRQSSLLPPPSASVDAVSAPTAAQHTPHAPSPLSRAHRHHRQHSHSSAPEPADGTVFTMSFYRAFPHMYFSLAQPCDLSQWRLLESPERPLGVVRVCPRRCHSRLPSSSSHHEPLRDANDSRSTSSAESDVPSLALYGSTSYQQRRTPLSASREHRGPYATPLSASDDGCFSDEPDSSSGATTRITRDSR